VAAGQFVKAGTMGQCGRGVDVKRQRSKLFEKFRGAAGGQPFAADDLSEGIYDFQWPARGHVKVAAGSGPLKKLVGERLLLVLVARKAGRNVENERLH